MAWRAPTLQVIYNTDNVKPGEEPKSFAELTTPKWKDRLVLVDPFQSAGLRDFFYAANGFGENTSKRCCITEPLCSHEWEHLPNALQPENEM